MTRVLFLMTREIIDDRYCVNMHTKVLCPLQWDVGLLLPECVELPHRHSDGPHVEVFRELETGQGLGRHGLPRNAGSGPRARDSCDVAPTGVVRRAIQK